MRELVSDGASGKCKADIEAAFFKAASAPPWHGRNFDALNDSIATGEINRVEFLTD